jgi:hypothetical protein
MFDVEFALRASAVVAAIALVASPALVAMRPRWSWSWSASREEVTDDAKTVLDIARRLQAAGNVEGVRLCKGLIDVLLKPEK